MAVTPHFRRLPTAPRRPSSADPLHGTQGTLAWAGAAKDVEAALQASLAEADPEARREIPEPDRHEPTMSAPADERVSDSVNDPSVVHPVNRALPAEWTHAHREHKLHSSSTRPSSDDRNSAEQYRGYGPTAPLRRLEQGAPVPRTARADSTAAGSVWLGSIRKARSLGSAEINLATPPGMNASPHRAMLVAPQCPLNRRLPMLAVAGLLAPRARSNSRLASPTIDRHRSSVVRTESLAQHEPRLLCTAVKRR